jgi:hypothetical protein
MATAKALSPLKRLGSAAGGAGRLRKAHADCGGFTLRSKGEEQISNIQWEECRTGFPIIAASSNLREQ